MRVPHAPHTRPAADQALRSLVLFGPCCQGGLEQLAHITHSQLAEVGFEPLLSDPELPRPPSPPRPPCGQRGWVHTERGAGRLLGHPCFLRAPPLGDILPTQAWALLGSILWPHPRPDPAGLCHHGKPASCRSPDRKSGSVCVLRGTVCLSVSRRKILQYGVKKWRALAASLWCDYSHFTDKQAKPEV